MACSMCTQRYSFTSHKGALRRPSALQLPCRVISLSEEVFVCPTLPPCPAGDCLTFPCHRLDDDSNMHVNAHIRRSLSSALTLHSALSDDTKSASAGKNSSLGRSPERYASHTPPRLMLCRVLLTEKKLTKTWFKSEMFG